MGVKRIAGTCADGVCKKTKDDPDATQPQHKKTHRALPSTGSRSDGSALLSVRACGWTMDPPADMEYAVLPDGVAMISPSPWTVVTKPSSQKHSRCVSAADRPRSITTSFSTTCSSEQTKPQGRGWWLLAAPPGDTGGGGCCWAEAEAPEAPPLLPGFGARRTEQRRRWRRVMWKPPCVCEGETNMSVGTGGAHELPQQK